MEAFSDILKGDRRPGLYRLTTAINLDSFSLQLQKQGWKLFYIEGTRVNNKFEFLQECARAMHFPSYFGNNWDAFEECMTDPEIISARGFILLFNQPETFIRHDPAQWSIAVHILQTAIDYWREKNVSMIVLLKTNHSILAELEDL